MPDRQLIPLAALGAAVIFVLGTTTPVHSQRAGSSTVQWTPPRLSDGQPDIHGMWNNEDANHIPLELPDELAGRTSFTKEELQKLAEARFKNTIEANERLRDGDPGFYALYWFDWYWRRPTAGNWPAMVVEPANGKMPALTPAAAKMQAHMRDHLHDTYANMEAGDRCISRGVLGMMMPTAYNNGKLILQTPGYVVILSEMVHNARIIPINGSPHVGDAIRQWEGDPRGRWEGNTLVVESTNFKVVPNLRSPNGRAMQTEKRRMIERFTPLEQDTLKYSVTVDDPDTYVAPWTVAFLYRRDDKYQQFEYACHEGNYAVPNSLSGARAQEH
jgi:hypothetical protein